MLLVEANIIPGHTTYCVRTYDLSNPLNAPKDEDSVVVFPEQAEVCSEEKGKDRVEQEQAQSEMEKQKQEEGQTVKLWEAIVNIDIQAASLSGLIPAPVLTVLQQIYCPRGRERTKWEFKMEDSVTRQPQPKVLPFISLSLSLIQEQ